MYDDPEFIECTCNNRALRVDERVEYIVPKKDGTLIGYVFAKDCPIHGYSVNPATDDAENA